MPDRKLQRSLTHGFRLPRDRYRRVAGWLDNTTGGGGLIRRELRHIFPDDWSFFFGEIALYCFVILIATGVYMCLFFKASAAPTVYLGSYRPLHGVGDVRGLQLGAAPELRHARRPRHTPGAPLGRPDLRRGARPAPLPHVLHRRLPPAAAPQLGDRPEPAEPGLRQRRVRLLAARRPAVGHRPADRLLDHAVDAAHRPEPRLAAVRRRLSHDGPDPAHLRDPYPAGAGGHRRPARARTWACSGSSATRSTAASAAATASSSARRWCPPTRCAPRASCCCSRACSRPWAASSRSTRSGSTGPTTPGTRRASRSPTGTPAGSRARCA